VSATVRDLDARVAPVAQAFIAALTNLGYRVTLTSTRRDPAQQKKLYDCYRRVGCSDCSKRPGQAGCFPAAPPGQSTHAIGAAFDLKLEPADYATAGRVWEAIGFTWGGRFSDPIHFDFRPFTG
jgi:D-alanyl-D-alanine carboxypeptidase